MNKRQAPVSNLQFLKLGGSLITDKAQPATARHEVINRIAAEIKTALESDETLRLLLGHGSGSFGHVPAKKHKTRQGVRTPEEWRGFVEVWQQAAALNHIVLKALQDVGLSAISVAPSASISAQDGAIASWNVHPIHGMIEQGLLPLVYGDVAFDTARGGTILSTEDLFQHLARDLRPARILLAGQEPGVCADYPNCAHLLEEITHHNLAEISPSLSGSAHPDVTGGMASKVHDMLDLVAKVPGLEVRIFGGEREGAIKGALLGEPLGTRIHAP